MGKTINAGAIEQLHLSPAIKRDLQEFLQQIAGFYRQDLLSITAIGSCVTGDYFEPSSDVNLLVVYSDLNIVDLCDVAAIARKWLKQHNFAPRFLSRRNLTESSRYFQIDTLEMKDARAVLYGEDILAGMTVDPQGLHWQLAYEIKSMRMRIKQQYWRTCDNELRAQVVLRERFTSLIHLIRALLFLMQRQPPVSMAQVMEMAVPALGLNRGFVDTMFQLKRGEVTLRGPELSEAFAGIMDLIRIVDQRTSEVTF